MIQEFCYCYFNWFKIIFGLNRYLGTSMIVNDFLSFLWK